MFKKVVLGLGSNLGLKELVLRRAIHLLVPAVLRQPIISSVYESDALLPDSAPAEWNKPYLNLAVCGQTDLAPAELLEKIKNIEKLLGRKNSARWAPREIDIDILAYEDEVWGYDSKGAESFKNSDDAQSLQSPLSIPHPALLDRPFSLLPLAEVWPAWRYPVQGQLHGKTAAELAQKWSTENMPYATRRAVYNLVYPELVGILNITPDSFSDGGRFTKCSNAYEHLIAMANSGATVIDIGAESTRPGAKPLSAAEEWSRLEPFFEGLFSKKETMEFLKAQQVYLSLDSRHPSNVNRLIASGHISWVNDVTGFSTNEMLKTISNSNVHLVFMHSLSVPVDRNLVLPHACDPVEELLQWGEDKIKKFEVLGIVRERLVFDPGIGFGKTAEQNLKILQHINRFHELGVRLLVGHSRKSFFSLFTDRPFSERDIETVACSVELAKKHVHYLRVHNVEMHQRVFRVIAALQ